MQTHAQSDRGLRALYCLSRLLYVQKRWPAKTFFSRRLGATDLWCFDLFFTYSFYSFECYCNQVHSISMYKKNDTTWENGF